MAIIQNKTQTVLDYLRAGGKVELIEDRAQRNITLKVDGHTIYPGNSTTAINLFNTATSEDIQAIFNPPTSTV